MKLQPGLSRIPTPKPQNPISIYMKYDEDMFIYFVLK